MQNFEKQMQNFSEKVAKIHKNFENTRLILKEGFIREPNLWINTKYKYIFKND